MAKQRQVLVAIADETVRKGVCAALAKEPDLVLHEATTKEVLQQRLRKQKFDLVVVHQSLITDIKILPRGQFVLLVSEPDMEIYGRARFHGARAYLSQNAPSHLLREALRLSEGEFLTDPAITVWLADYFSHHQLLLIEESVLTAKEQAVFRLFWEGLNQTEIAKELNLSPSTVRVHLSHIYKKLKMNPNQAKILSILNDQKGEKS